MLGVALPALFAAAFLAAPALLFAADFTDPLAAADLPVSALLTQLWQ